MSFGGILRQSTAVDVLIGPFVDSTDGDSEEGALTISQGDVLLSKNGQAAAQKNDNTACAADADGFYNCELDATDTNTVGQLTLYVHEAGALCVRHDYQVVEEAVYDILYAASATGAVPVASIAAGAITATAIADGAIDAATFAAGAIDAAAIAANAIGASELAADAVAEIADAVWDEDATGHQTGGTFGQAIGDPAADTNTIYGAVVTGAAGATVAADIVAVKAETAAIVADTNELQTDWTNGGRLDLLIDATLADTNELQTDWTNGGRLDLIIDAILADTAELQTDWVNGGRLDLLLDATLADTNELQTDWANGGRLDLILDARASQASVDAVDDFIDTEVAAVLAAVDTEIAAILALLDDARGEPGQGTPAVNPDLATKIDYLYKAWRNRTTQTASEYALYADDGTTKDQEAACTDDGVTFVRGEIQTGA